MIIPGKGLGVNMSSQKIILFDLELTLINDWENRRLMIDENPGLLPWIKGEGEFRAGLLSCAVWDESDLVSFQEELQDRIEQVFGFKFDPSLFLTRDMMMEKIRVWSRMPFLSSEDFSDFFKKREIVEMFWLNQFNQEGVELVLLDDTVPNLTMVNNDVAGNTCRMVNPLRWPIG